MNADALALSEQVVRHVLKQQGELLKRKDATSLISVITSLNELMTETQQLLWSGSHRIKNVDALVAKAQAVEREADSLSEQMWTPIPVCVSAIYSQWNQALKPRKDKFASSVGVRSHYENMRIRLLQQTFGVRMLRGISDPGLEMEQIWQEFFQWHLGDSVRVLKGGAICDYDGDRAPEVGPEGV